MSKSLAGIELLKDGCLPGAATYNQVARAIQRCSSASPNLDIRLKADGGMEFELNDIVRDDDYRALRYPFKATIARNKDNGNVISWKWRGGVIHQQSKDIIVEPGTASFNQQEPYLWLTITNEGTARVTSGKMPEREPKTSSGQPDKSLIIKLAEAIRNGEERYAVYQGMLGDQIMGMPLEWSFDEPTAEQEQDPEFKRPYLAVTSSGIVPMPVEEAEAGDLDFAFKCEFIAEDNEEGGRTYMWSCAAGRILYGNAVILSVSSQSVTDISGSTCCWLEWNSKEARLRTGSSFPDKPSGPSWHDIRPLAMLSGDKVIHLQLGDIHLCEQPVFSLYATPTPTGGGSYTRWTVTAGVIHIGEKDIPVEIQQVGIEPYCWIDCDGETATIQSGSSLPEKFREGETYHFALAHYDSATDRTEHYNAGDIWLDAADTVLDALSASIFYDAETETSQWDFTGGTIRTPQTAWSVPSQKLALTTCLWVEVAAEAATIGSGAVFPSSETSVIIPIAEWDGERLIRHNSGDVAFGHHPAVLVSGYEKKDAQMQYVLEKGMVKWQDMPDYGIQASLMATASVSENGVSWSLTSGKVFWDNVPMQVSKASSTGGSCCWLEFNKTTSRFVSGDAWPTLPLNDGMVFHPLATLNTTTGKAIWHSLGDIRHYTDKYHTFALEAYLYRGTSQENVPSATKNWHVTPGKVFGNGFVHTLGIESLNEWMKPCLWLEVTREKASLAQGNTFPAKSYDEAAEMWFVRLATWDAEHDLITHCHVGDIYLQSVGEQIALEASVIYDDAGDPHWHVNAGAIRCPNFTYEIEETSILDFYAYVCIKVYRVGVVDQPVGLYSSDSPDNDFDGAAMAAKKDYVVIPLASYDKDTRKVTILHHGDVIWPHTPFNLLPSFVLGYKWALIMNPDGSEDCMLIEDCVEEVGVNG